MFQATRRRLALWYTIVTAILLLLFATGVYFYVRSTLIERIDDTLKHVVEVVERSLVIESNSDQIPYRVNIEASFRNNQSTVEDDHIDLEWFSATGNLLWSTLSEPLDFPLHPDRIGETVRVNRQASETAPSPNLGIRSYYFPNTNSQSSILSYQLRQVTERVQVGRYVLGYLRVSHPWFEVTKPIRQLLIDLALGTTIMAIAVGAIGWFLSGLAIAPVRESYQRLKQFTADASHELRNPIATIQANVQMALSYPDWEPQQQRQQLYTVERLTQRLGRLVNDLLFLARTDSRMTSLEWQAVPLDALLMEVVEEQQIVANKKGVTLVLNILETLTSDWLHHAKGERLSLADFGLKSPIEDETHREGDYQDEPFTIQGDWDQLVRLFTNLVSNAVQYSCLESDVREPLVEVELQRHPRSPNSILVKVRDNGVGIAPAALPYIFERFYRVDPARTSGGTGLGLAIAEAIVENHQGYIQVESVLNQGTTFTVTLPASNVNS